MTTFSNVNVSTAAPEESVQQKGATSPNYLANLLSQVENDPQTYARGACRSRPYSCRSICSLCGARGVLPRKRDA